MKISVLGTGRWGSFIAWYLSLKNDVIAWGKADSPQIQELMATRTNGIVTMSEKTLITTDLEKALENDIIVISIASQYLASFAREISQIVPKNHYKRFILCMKGLEEGTGRRLTEVFNEEYKNPHDIAVWVGPGHVQDFVCAIPNCMLIDSENEEYKKELAEKLSSSLIRFYIGQDLIGSEVGAASKNVIGIAAGILDGLEWYGLKGALMARAPVEVGRFIAALGGDARTAYGLSHLGDYEATLFSKHSHNRTFGEKFAKGEDFGKLAEGVATLKAVKQIADERGIDMPICQALYKAVYEKADIKTTIKSMFDRQLKQEF